MASRKKSLWLPMRPLVSVAAELPPLRYQIKTLVVSARASIEPRQTAGGFMFCVRASAKIPFKTAFSYECDVEAAHVVAADGGRVQFSKFSESHGPGFRQGAVDANGVHVGDETVAWPLGLMTLVALAQSPYILYGADGFDRAYAGLLVGRHPQLVRFELKSEGVYQISALALDGYRDISDLDELDWSSAHAATIYVRRGLIDKIQVSLPFLGSVAILRVP